MHKREREKSISVKIILQFLEKIIYLKNNIVEHVCTCINELILIKNRCEVYAQLPNSKLFSINIIVNVIPNVNFLLLFNDK